MSRIEHAIGSPDEPYQPKGSMCAACQHAKRDCSALPFGQMPVIKRYPDGVKAVRCQQFEKGISHVPD